MGLRDRIFRRKDDEPTAARQQGDPTVLDREDDPRGGTQSEAYRHADPREVAEEAGIAYGLVYHYFDSKEALLETIFRTTWAEMLARVEEVEAAGVPAPEAVRQVTALLLRTWRRDPDLVRVLVREVTRNQHVQQEIEEITAAMETLERIVRRGQESGEFRQDLDPRLAAVVFYGALEEVLSSWVLGQLRDRDADIARAEQNVVALLTGGLAL